MDTQCLHLYYCVVDFGCLVCVKIEQFNFAAKWGGKWWPTLPCFALWCGRGGGPRETWCPHRRRCLPTLLYSNSKGPRAWSLADDLNVAGFSQLDLVHDAGCVCACTVPGSFSDLAPKLAHPHWGIKIGLSSSSGWSAPSKILLDVISCKCDWAFSVLLCEISNMEFCWGCSRP